MLKKQQEVLLFHGITSDPINAFKKTGLSEMLPSYPVGSFASRRPHARIQ
jgi:hypothetical protein